MLRLAFDFIITWRETRTRPNAYRQTAVDTASYGNFSCQITLAQEGRILQEIHFK